MCPKIPGWSRTSKRNVWRKRIFPIDSSTNSEVIGGGGNGSGCLRTLFKSETIADAVGRLPAPFPIRVISSENLPERVTALFDPEILASISSFFIISGKTYTWVPCSNKRRFAINLISRPIRLAYSKSANSR